MKNQYFGDENDYKKYGILRTILSFSDQNILVAWMLTNHDDSNYGEQREYFEKPDQFRDADPDLFDSLKRIVVDENIRDVKAAERVFDSDKIGFYTKILNDDVLDRFEYFKQLEKECSDSGLIFFDPDTGFAPKSVKKGLKDSSRYLFYDELGFVFNELGKSVLVYQHWIHEDREEFARKVAGKIFMWTGATEVCSLATSKMVFLLIPQAGHKELLSKAVAKIEKNWKDHIEVTWHPGHAAPVHEIKQPV